MLAPQYPEEIVRPMRQQLTDAGFVHLMTAKDVEKTLSVKETVFLVINSICGCAAGNARPGAILAIKNSVKKPDHLVTVFAGMEKEAVAQARELMPEVQGSSPSMALLKKGKLVYFLPRTDIERSSPEAISEKLMKAFEEYCR